MIYSDQQRSGYNLREVERLSRVIAEQKELLAAAKKRKAAAEKNYMLAKLSRDPAVKYRAAIELRNICGVIQTCEKSISRYDEQRIAKYYNI